MVALVALKIGIYLFLAMLILLGIQTLRLDWAENSLKSYRSSQEAYERVRLIHLKEAKDANIKERDDDLQYRRDHPINDVRLCTFTLQTRTAALPTAGSASPSLPQVHEGDHSSGEGVPGPDISRLLEAYGASCESVSGDLRRQQASP